MVHLADFSNRVEYNAIKDFWKLEKLSRYSDLQKKKEILIESGYDDGRSSDPARLEHCWTRCQLGLLSYASCTVDELRLFCANRNIKVRAYATRATGDCKTPAKAVMTKLLETADKNQVFDRFLDLPPELRNRIYEMHMNGMGWVHIGSRPPPVCRASRQLRHETVPVWFYTRPLDVNIALPAGLSGNRITFNAHSQKISTLLSADVGERLTPVKKVVVKCDFFNTTPSPQSYTWFVFSLEIKTEGKKYELKQTFPRRLDRFEGGEAVSQRMVTKMKEQLDAILSEHSILQVTPKMLDDFKLAWAFAFWKKGIRFEDDRTLPGYNWITSAVVRAPA